jgi:hypothetical protein
MVEFIHRADTPTLAVASGSSQSAKPGSIEHHLEIEVRSFIVRHPHWHNLDRRNPLSDLEKNGGEKMEGASGIGEAGKSTHYKRAPLLE